MNETDDKNMRLAIREAKKSKAEDGRTHPKVGVVVVTDSFCGRAFRGEKGPGEHAEYTALEKKYHNQSIAGATVYVTLEPCTSRKHTKRPCAEWLIERKVGRVVIGMLDPNPQICGRGIRRLRDANIAVDLFPTGLMAQVEELNREFIRQFEKDSFRVPVELNSGAGANLINPHYGNDLQRLDDSDFNLRTIIGPETIFIVVGDGVAPTLLDRPVAGMLRDEIDQRGKSGPFKRAIIVGVQAWLDKTPIKMEKYPTISIGGSASNEVTGKIESTSKDKWQSPGGICGAFVDEGVPRVALWGDNASQTREAVLDYVRKPEGLDAFLKLCWK